MEQDQIHLDAQRFQLIQMGFETVPEVDIWLACVGFSVLRMEWVEGRFSMDQIIVLGEYAHTDLIERCRLQRSEGLRNDLIRLVGQGIDGSADRDILAPVLKNEMGLVGFHHAVGSFVCDAELFAGGSHDTAHFPLPQACFSG